MARSGPPAYAWDWFTRQRLLWRESRSRLAAADQPLATRYSALEARAETVTLLRADYERDERVRAVVDGVVSDLVFLGRTHGTFASLGLHNAPRGLRWWWFALTGEEPDTVEASGSRRSAAQAQLSLDDLAGEDIDRAMEQVQEGYGDERLP